VSKRSKAADAAVAAAPGVWKSFIGDSFQNFLARIGIGAGSANDASTYGFNPVTRNRVLMERMYRGSWVAGISVDARAEDMTREGVEIRSDDKPDAIEAIAKEAERLQIWDALCDALKWSRLYGGAVGLMLIEGQQLNTPLRMETVSAGQFRGIKALDRWVVQPNLQDLITEYGPHLGLPKFYRIVDNTIGLPLMDVHHSRLMRLEGVKLPHYQRIAENLWGQSICERLWDRLIAFDSTTAGAAQLVYKAHLRTVKIKGLRDIVATGGKVLDGLLAQINMMRLMQTNEGLTVLDLEDDFDAKQYTFSGLSDVLLQFGQQLAGATQIPLVRFFGQSPAGLNSTGDSDWRNYYDSIRAEQESRLRPGIETVYRLLYRSVHGREVPESYGLHFRPLWQMTEPERATVTNTMTAAVVAPFTAQIIDRGTALRELRKISEVTGAFSSITDQQINEAESEGPPPSAREVLESSTDPDAGPGEKGGKSEGEDADQ